MSGMARTKADLVAEIAEALDARVDAVAPVIDAFMVTVIKHVSKGEDIELRGFGTFHPSVSRARVVTHPSGKLIEVPAKARPSFRPTRAFRTAVKDGVPVEPSTQESSTD